MKTLNEIKERIALREDKLRRSLGNIVGQLKSIGAIKIVVFGSFIAGKITPSSDLDILAIMPATKTGKEWLKQIYAQIDRNISCDIFAFNIKEYDENKDKNFLLREVIKKGKVLYEKGV